MKILHLSDTHGCHRRLGDLPEADVVVHSGDFCMVGSEREAIDFLDWLCDLPHRHKIFICGNHDECLYEATISGLGPGVHYLCNSGIEIDGISFYGVPMFLHDSLSGRQAKHLSALPSGTDVVITHTPPHGILDFADGINYGSPVCPPVSARSSPGCTCSDTSTLATASSRSTARPTQTGQSWPAAMPSMR